MQISDDEATITAAAIEAALTGISVTWIHGNGMVHLPGVVREQHREILRRWWREQPTLECMHGG